MAEFDLKSLMQNSSIVGAGGAGFPSFAKLAEGADVEGKRVLIIEDVVTTGGAIIDGVRELRKRGAIAPLFFYISFLAKHLAHAFVSLPYQ